MKLSASLVLPAKLAGMDFQVKGEGPDGIALPPTDASVILNGDETTLSINDIACDNALEDKIAFYDPFEIVWSVSCNNGQSWFEAARTRTQIYVTLDEPKTQRVDLLHTLLHIGCKYAAGETEAAAALDKIWAGLATLNVHNAKGSRQLAYWKNYDVLKYGVGENAEYLVANGDAQCGGWADLLPKILWCLGIHFNDIQRVLLTPNVFTYPEDYQFILIKKYSFSSPQYDLGYTDYPYSNWIRTEQDLLQHEHPTWLYAEVQEQAGVGAQGNSDPRSIFGGHIVCQANGYFYDPSYGLKEKAYSITNVPREYIAATGFAEYKTVRELTVGIDLNGNGLIEDILVKVYWLYIRPREPHELAVGTIPMPYD